MIVHGSFGLAPPFHAQFRDLAKRLAAQGYMAFLPSYFFAGNLSEANLDPRTHLTTLTDALDFATSHPGADDQHVALIGFSLGGGLSLALAESSTPGRIKAVVDFYGPTTPDILKDAGKLPPTLILHNRPDGIVPISNSQDLDAALGKSLISHRFKVYNEHNPDPRFKDHPFAPAGPADKDSQEQIISWLGEHLK
jgi:dienelactone hydrolase